MADFAVTWAHWRLHRLRLGKPVRIRFRQHLYTRSMAFSDDRKRDQVTRWLEHRGRPGAQFDRVVRLQRGGARSAPSRSPGSAVSTSSSSRTRSTSRSSGRASTACRSAIGRSAATWPPGHDAAYVDFVAAAGLRSCDFRDLTHMLYPGQVKYEAELARLAPRRGSRSFAATPRR